MNKYLIFKKAKKSAICGFFRELYTIIDYFRLLWFSSRKFKINICHKTKKPPKWLFYMAGVCGNRTHPRGS